MEKGHKQPGEKVYLANEARGEKPVAQGHIWLLGPFQVAPRGFFKKRIQIIITE